MSKVKKKIIYALLLVVTFLSVTTVNAAGKKIEVSDFSVKDKSGTITVEDPVITDNLVTSNITFNEVGDFVTFKLVLKNNENEKYKIESITDNNTNKNLTIDYTFSKDFINTGETSTVEMKLTYKNKLINQDKISLNDLTIKINLVNEDGKSENIIINPTTGDTILHYLVLLILALTGLILSVNKKKIKGMKIGNLIIVLAIILTPFAIFAKEKYEVQIKFNDIDIIGEYETYNITIDPKNGDPAVTKQITYGEKIGALPADPTKDGYTFDKWVDNKGNTVTEDTTITGPISIEAKYNIVKYDITYNLDGGSVSGNPTKYTIEDTITLKNPSKQGYTFAGWTGTGIDTQTTSVTIPVGSTGARNYVAHYSASEDTAYTVIHKFAKLTEGYDIEEVTEHGTTGSTVPAPRKTRTGFVTPSVQNVIIAADGSASVTYIYERETYAFSITDRTYIDASSTEDGTYPYGTEITAKAVARPGYDFTWSDGNTNLERTFELSEETNLTPEYTAKTNTPYKVIHRKQKVTLDGYVEADTQNLTGTTDTEVTPSVNTYTGFTSPSTQTVTIDGNGSTVVTYDYDRETYAFSITDRTYIDPTSAVDGNYPYEKEITVKALERAGYGFKWSDDDTNYEKTITITGPVTLAPIYTADENTPYTVKHMKQKINGDYELADTDNLTGTTDTEITPSVKTYEGFTSPSTQTTTISGDGHTLVTYNYTRNKYALTITHPEYVEEDKSGNYYYEEKVTLTAIDRQGYTFAGWSSGENTKTITVTMGDSDITVEPLYTSDLDTEYKVIHKYAKLTSGYDIEEVTGTGETGSTIPAPLKPKTGFVTPAEQNITITGDGQATVTYEYERETYAFNITDRSYLDSTSTANGTYPYETEITLKAKTREGYTFKWSDDVTDLERTFNLTEATTLSLIYTANTNTPYKVIHKYAKLTSGYDIEEVPGTGTTDTTISAPLKPKTGFVTPTEQNIKITGDGEATVTYTYERVEYTFEVTNRSYLDNTSTPNGSYPYETTINLKALAREGYTFAWSDEVTELERSFNIDKNTSLSLVYIPNIYTIVFDPNTGVGDMEDQDMSYDETDNLIPNTFTKEGYSFVGWNTRADGQGTPYLDEAEVTNLATSGTITLYAQWIINEYTVSFDTDGGSTVPSQTIAHGGKVTRPATDPTKTGCTFDDWYEDSNYQTLFDFTNTTITSTTTIYGRFTSNSYTVTFDTDGGSTIPSQTITHGGKVTRPATDPTKTGYTFDDWYVDSNYQTLFDFTNTTITSTTTIYGKFDINSYTVTAYANGGSIEATTGWTGTGSTATKDVEYNSAIGTLPEASRSGYVLAGWNTSADGTGTNVTTSTTVSSATPIYAQWIEAKAMFDTGENLNVKMKKLAGNPYASSSTPNSNITSIQKSSTKPDISSMTSDNIVSISNEIYSAPIYMWYDNGTIYWWTEDEKPSLNSDSSKMFYNIANIGSLDLSVFDVNEVTSMKDMFKYCVNLTSLNLGNEFDTSNVIDMEGMFAYCNCLTSLDLGDNFDTSKVTNMKWMFNSCVNLTSLDLGDKFDTSCVTDMSGMFQRLDRLSTLDLGDNFDTSEVTDMSYMFSGCFNLTSINFKNKFDTSNVSNMENMFSSSNMLEYLDLSSFNTSKVTNMESMFSYCSSLKTIYASNLFDTSSVTNSSEMFKSNTELVGGMGTVYDSDHIDKEYAHIDEGTSNPGYFTARASDKYTVSFDSDGGSAISDIEVNPGDSIDELPTPTKADSIFVGWFEDESDTDPVSEPYTPSGDITLIAKWNNIICKKATTLHTETCNQTDGSKYCSGYGYANGDTITFGNIISSDTYQGGDAFDCDVDGTGYNQRFYYLRTKDNKAVLISNKNYTAASKQADQNISFIYSQAHDQLPTTSDWGNLPVMFDGKPARLITMEDLLTVTGASNPDDLSSNGSLKGYEFLFESSNFSGIGERSTQWLEEISSTKRYRYRNDQYNLAKVETGKENTSKNPVRPVIEVPLDLIEDAYIVKFDANGGTSDTYVKVQKGSTIGTLPTATKTGYYLNGWYTSLDYTIPVTENTIPVSFVTYYAKWVLPVTDAQLNTDNFIIQVGETNQIEVSNESDIEQYTFVSNDENIATVDTDGTITAVSTGTTTISMVGSKSGLSKTINVKVQAEVTDYVVSFDSQGGSPVNDMIVPKNTTLGTLPETPTYEGYDFGGWYTNTNYSTEVTVDTLIISDATFYALWIPTNAVAEINHRYFTSLQSAVDSEMEGKTTIKLLKDISINTYIDLFGKNTDKNIVLDLNNKTLTGTAGQTIKTKTTLEIKNGTVTQTSSNGTIDIGPGGHLIINSGTVSNSGSRAAIYNDGGIVEIGGTAVFTSNAQFVSNNQRATVQNKSGSTTITGGTITNTRASDSYGVSAIAGTLVIGTEDGVYDTDKPVIQGETGGIYSTINMSIYDGIMKGKSKAVSDESKIVNIETGSTKINEVQGDYKVLYYQLESEKYKITLDPNAGEVNPTFILIDQGDQVGELPTPIRGQYVFDGWWTGITDGVQVQSTDVPTKNTTYYARWHYNSTTDVVNFNMNNDAIETYANYISSWKDLPQSTFQANMMDNMNTNSCSKCDQPNSCNNPTAGTLCDQSVGYNTGVSSDLKVYTSDETTKTKGSLVSYTTSSNGIIYNMIPGETYYWEAADDSTVYGIVKANGYRRLIKSPVRNVRDLGGLAVDTDGDGTSDGRIKYGILFRGAQLSSNQSDATSLQKLGITRELDLRPNSEGKDKGQAVLPKYDIDTPGSEQDVIMHNYVISYSSHPNYYTELRNTIKTVMNYVVEDDDSIFFHCTIGTDRTGTLAYFLEGLLGVSEEDRLEDYELSYYFGMTNRDRYHDYLQNSSYNPRFTTMYNTYNTNAKIYEWFMNENPNITQAEKDADEILLSRFRQKMIE